MRRRRRYVALLAAGVIASVAFGAFAMRGVDFDLFWSSITEMDYVWLAPALLTLAAAVYVRAQRWRLMFLPASRPSLQPTLRSMLIGLLFNQILPFRAGEAIRIVTLNREVQTSRAEAAGTVVVERIFDVLALLLILFGVWTIRPSVPWIQTAAILALVLSALLAAAIVVLAAFGARALRPVLAPLALIPGVTRLRTDTAAERLAHGLEALRSPSRALTAFAVTLGSWLVVGVSYSFVIEGFDLGIDFAGALVVLVATNLAYVIPSLPASVGVFEAATIVALGLYSVGESEALACAVVLHGVNFFPYIAAGLVALYSHARLRQRAAVDPGLWRDPRAGT